MSASVPVRGYPQILPLVASAPRLMPRYLSRLDLKNWYAKSKLLNLFFARGLGERIPDDIPIKVTSVCPGYCHSDLNREVAFPFNHLDSLAKKLLAYTSEEGSRQLIWAAIGGAGREKELQGAFITQSDITEPSDYVLGEEGKRVQNQLWVGDLYSLHSFPDLWLSSSPFRWKPLIYSMGYLRRCHRSLGL